jgi:TolA-binding protein
MKRMKAIKQHCIYLAIFLALMFSATAVFAQEDSTTSTEPEAIEESTEAETTETTETEAADDSEPDDTTGAGDQRSALQERIEEVRNNQAERIDEFENESLI